MPSERKELYHKSKEDKRAYKKQIRGWENKEFCYDYKDKRGNKRKEIGVQSCFPYLVKWIVNWWDSTLENFGKGGFES